MEKKCGNTEDILLLCLSLKPLLQNDIVKVGNLTDMNKLQSQLGVQLATRAHGEISKCLNLSAKKIQNAILNDKKEISRQTNKQTHGLTHKHCWLSSSILWN